VKGLFDGEVVVNSLLLLLFFVDLSCFLLSASDLVDFSSDFRAFSPRKKWSLVVAVAVAVAVAAVAVAVAVAQSTMVNIPAVVAQHTATRKIRRTYCIVVLLLLLLFLMLLFLLLISFELYCSY